MKDGDNILSNTTISLQNANLEYYCVVLHQMIDVTRCFIVCCSTGEFITFHEEKNDMIVKRNGHKEISPEHIFEKATLCIRRAFDNYLGLSHPSNRIVSLSLCTQSNVTVVWSRSSGCSLYFALSEDDTRCDDTCQKLIQKSWRKSASFHHLCGLPISARWAAVKLRWLLDNIGPVQEAHKTGDLMFGTLDSWLLWKLTEGTCYATDVTNASYTMLMNLHRFSWDSVICKFLDIDPSLLPEIKSCAELYGRLGKNSACGLDGLPIAGVVCDLKASVLGYQGTHAGSVSLHMDGGTNVSKLSIVVGEEPVFYRSILKGVGHLTSTACYQLGAKDNVVYALEATIYNGQNVVPWLRDHANFLSKTDDLDAVANSVSDTGGCYFIPTTGPSHSPIDKINYRHVNLWGVSLSGTKPGHIVRAAFESIAVEVSQVLGAIASVIRVPYGVLHVSGPSVASSDAFCQVVADYSGLKVDRMAMSESVIVGGALLAVMGINMDPSGLRGPLKDSFSCLMVPGDRKVRCKRWTCLANEQETLDHRFYIGGGDNEDESGHGGRGLGGAQLTARDKKYLSSRSGWARRLLCVLVIGSPFTLLGFGVALLLTRTRLGALAGRGPW